MDDARRAELIARRALRQQDIARAAEVALLGALPARLDAAGVSYRMYRASDAGAPDWHQDLVPMGLMHLEWQKVATTLDVRLDWDAFDEEALAVVRDFVSPRAAPGDPVLFVSSNDACPMVEVRADALSAHLADLMQIDRSELWISGRGWLLEVRHPRVVGIG